MVLNIQSTEKCSECGAAWDRYHVNEQTGAVYRICKGKPAHWHLETYRNVQQAPAKMRLPGGSENKMSRPEG